MIDIQQRICFIIDRAIGENLSDLHSYDGQLIDSELSDAITAKENEFWQLVDRNVDLKNLLTGDCDLRNEVLAAIGDDQALLLLSKYHLNGDVNKVELDAKLKELGL